MVFFLKRGCNFKTMIHYYITCQKLYNTHHVCSPRKRGMPEMKENYARPIPGPRNTTKELSDVMDYPKPCVIAVTTTMGLLLRSIYTKVIRPWLLRILEFSLVDMSHTPPTLGLHEGTFGLKPLTFLVNEESTRNSTWQTWMMLVESVGEFFKTIVEGRHGGMCVQISSLR